jgi:hypothetical protein
MSLFGKILTFLNVLAAIGFFAMAGMDWGKRYAWAEAVLEHQLVIEGVPLDDHDLDLEGNPKSKNLRDQAVQRLFQPAGGQPVKTQVEEVQRVKAKLQQRIDDSGAKGTKAERLAEVLMHFVTSKKERDRVKQLGSDEKNTDELQSELDQLFSDVLAEGEASKHPPAERRALIAHVLFCASDILRLDEENPPPGLVSSKAYQRALVTTGLVSCTHEIKEETTRLTKFTEDVRASMARDREAFLAAHRTILAQVEDLAEKCERQKGVLKYQTELADKQRTLVEARRAEVIRMQKELAAAQEATQEQLNTQSAMESDLQKSRREQRDAFEKNVQLERQLRVLEKGR